MRDHRDVQKLRKIGLLERVRRLIGARMINYIKLRAEKVDLLHGFCHIKMSLRECLVCSFKPQFIAVKRRNLIHKKPPFSDGNRACHILTGIRKPTGGCALRA